MVPDNLGLLVLLGAGAGLVINFLADQIPRGGLKARPQCPACGRSLSWKDYAFGLRKCPYCGTRRLRPWLVVLGLAALTPALAQYPGRLDFWPMWVFLLYSTFNTVVDVEHRFLFPAVEAVAGLGALVFGIGRRGWILTTAGGVAGGLLMGMFYVLGLWMGKRLARRGVGRPEEPPLGSGDVILMGVLGLFLGWPAVVAALMAGVFLAGGFSLLLVMFFLVTRRTWPQNLYLPYAPFLLLGAWWVLYL